jgi:hypothetical protein
MKVFEFINAINDTKVDLFADPQAKKDYNAFIVNRGLSYFPDTIFYSNEMNKFNQLDVDMQFDFLLNSIPKKKRFSKWNKKETSTEDLFLIMQMYKYNYVKALDALRILNAEQLSIIRKRFTKGGKNDN